MPVGAIIIPIIESEADEFIRRVNKAISQFPILRYCNEMCKVRE